MIINFENLKDEKLDNFKGGNGFMLSRAFNDKNNKIMKNILHKGNSIGYHKHEGNCEIIYILSGEGIVNYDGEKSIVKSGEVHYCPEGHSHSLENRNDDDLVFFAVVAKQ